MKYLKIVISILFLTVVVVFFGAPKVFMQSFWDGLTVWAYNVLPALFPFAVLTSLALKFLPTRKRSFSEKLFGVSADGIYLSSLLCGYPIGAKAIADSNLDRDSATCAASFCSSASPVFVVATVGISLLNSAAASAILLFSHIFSTFVCGLFFKKRGGAVTDITERKSFAFGDIGNAVTSSVLSVLSVGGLIALFYMLTDMFKSLLPAAVAQSVAVGFLFGLIEMTNGIISVCALCDVFSATVLSGFLLSFGGLCVFAQTMTFLSSKQVSPLKVLQMKLVQGSVASVSAFLLGKLFL